MSSRTVSLFLEWCSMNQWIYLVYFLTSDSLSMSLYIFYRTTNFSEALEMYSKPEWWRRISTHSDHIPRPVYVIGGVFGRFRRRHAADDRTTAIISPVSFFRINRSLWWGKCWGKDLSAKQVRVRVEKCFFLIFFFFFFSLARTVVGIF